MTTADAPRISLILATYEMPRHLELVLTALRRQSLRSFEIHLCDDGSGPETRKIVEAFRTAFAAAGITLTHLWQENRGFRKCRLLNEAVRRSRGDLLVFLDGDCIPHRHFLRDHWETREAGTYGAGRRVELSKDASESIDAMSIEKGALDFPSLRLLADSLLGKTEHWNRTIRWGTLPPVRALLRLNRVLDMKGCNFSVFRKDLIAINGFDEAYEGYGREDTDVEIRLQHSGLRLRGMKGIALQYHVWHERRGFTPSNDSLLDEARATRKVRCARGIEGGDASGIRVD